MVNKGRNLYIILFDKYDNDDFMKSGKILNFCNFKF